MGFLEYIAEENSDRLNIQVYNMSELLDILHTLLF